MKSFNLKLFTLFIGALTANAETKPHQTYQVKKGDTLSQILYQFGLKPLYGRDGTINQALSLNGDKIKGRGNSIFVNQNILLPLEVGTSKYETALIPASQIEGTQVETREPSAQTQSETTIKFKLGTKASFLRIDSTDKSSKDSTIILSSLSPEIFGEANYSLTEKDKINFEASVLFYSLQKDDSSKIQSRKGNRSSIGINYLRDFGPLTTIVGASMKEEIFPISKNLGELTFEKKPILQGTIGLMAPIWKNKKSQINGKIGADYLSSQSSKSYDVLTGHRIWSGVNFLQNNHQLGIHFSITNQDTSIVTKKEQAAGISYQYHFGN
jgi:hypothetical protein